VPELPDVEAFRRHLHRDGLHRRIERVDLLDETACRATTPAALSEALRGHALAATGRRGKHLFAATTGRSTLVLHFGMTGHLVIAGAAETIDPHERLRLHFDDGGRLSVIDQRRLGFVSVTDDVDGYCAEHELGPDALDLSQTDLRQVLRNGRGGLKSTLMNQTLLAGIGNIYSDEICFAAHLAPDRLAGELDDNEVRRLHRQLRRVLLTAADRDADPHRFPRGWLVRHRHEGAPCPRCGTPVQKTRLAGRGAYSCPGCQH
jgi:formamidopyrimidine-DNA glycosylase